jgi:hypothetical protein
MCLCLSLLLAVAAEGRVVNAVDGRPVPRAIVMLQGLGNVPDVDSYILEADGDGCFRASDVAPGRYRVSATREDFTAPRADPLITVEAGQSPNPLELRLVPAGTISGVLTDSDGDPVSWVRVEVLSYAYSRGKRELVTRGYGRSDDRGLYRIAGLAPGRYYLRATGPGISSGTFLRVAGNVPLPVFGTTWFPGVSEVEAAVPVALAPGGEITDAHVRLRPEQRHTIRAAITGATSPVMLFAGSPGGMGLSLPWNPKRTFVYPNLAPGTYDLRAADKGQGTSARQLVKVAGADVDVTLALAPDVKIAGTVRLEGGRVRLEQVRVSLESDRRLETAVKADGGFAFESLQAGPYRVGVTLPPGA